MGTPANIIGEYLRKNVMDKFNGMIESAATQDKRERGWGGHEDEDEPHEEHYNLFADPDYLFQTAIDLSREQWARIKTEKGD